MLLLNRRQTPKRPEEESAGSSFWGKLATGLTTAIGTVAAPFTGGASLALPAAAGATQALAEGDVGGAVNAAAGGAAQQAQPAPQAQRQVMPMRQRDPQGEYNRDAATLSTLGQMRQTPVEDPQDALLRRRMTLWLAGRQGPMYR